MNTHPLALRNYLRHRLRDLLAPLICGCALAAAPPAIAGPPPLPSLTMNLSPDTIGIGSCTELTFTIQNDSPSPVTGLDFSLPLPAGVVLTTAAILGNDCGGTLVALDGGNSVTLTGGEVGGNATCTIQVALTITGAGPFPLTTGNLTSSAGTSNPATATLGTPPSGPVLGFTKSFSPNLVTLGGNSTLTYTIQNQSLEDAAQISFTDMLPAGIAIANPANISISCPGTALTATPGTQEIVFSPLTPDPTLPSGQSCTLSVDVVGVTPGLNKSISGNLTASSGGAAPVSSGRACAVLEVIDPTEVANLTFTKSFTDDPIDPGGTGTLEFTITNNSQTGTASDISFTDDLNATLPGLVATSVPTDGGIVIDAQFGATGSANLIGGTWDYLDRMENENGANQDYPDDGDGDEWNSPDFDPATSTIGPWGSGAAPLQAGLVDGFPPATPDLLFGIDAAPNGENLITTYLFRHDFTATAAQLTIDDWILEYLIDDGGIVFLNGVEIYRTPNMPGDPIFTTTLSGLGDEAAFASAPVDLTGILVEGHNSLAVEVHQTTLESSDVGFFLELLPASESSTAGFTYADDTFEGTADPDFAAGSVDPAGGFDGAALSIVAGGQTGGLFGGGGGPASGAWSRTFTIDSAVTTTVSFRYRLVLGSEYEDDEFGQAIFELDGIRYGSGPNSSLAQLIGDGTGGADADTGWQSFTRTLFLSAGTHTMSLGVYNNNSTQDVELTRVWFDDVEVGTPATPARICGPASSLTGTDVLTLAGGSLAPGQSCSFSVEVQVPVTTPTGDYLNTTSRLTTSVSQAPLIALPATDTLRVEPIPPAFTKGFSPDAVAEGGTSTLTFTIDNGTSKLDAEDIDFTDTLPAGIVIADPPNATTTCTGGTLTAAGGSGVVSYTGGSVAAGATCTITVDVVAGTAPGEFVNISGECNSSLGNSGTASATLTVVPPPLFSKSFAPASINAGQVGTLTFTIDNSASPIAATGIAFTDNLPADLVLSTPANPSTTCIGGSINAGPGNSVVSYSGGTVPAGAICTLTAEITATEGGSYENTSGNLTSSLGNSGTATDTLDVNPIVAVRLTKSESIDPVVAGSGTGNLTYIVTATNNGPSTATGVTVSEALTLPTDVSLVEITPSPGTTWSDPTWNIGTLAANTSATLTVVLTVGPSAAPGTNLISDTATLETVNETNNITGEPVVTESTSIVSRVDLEVTQTESSDPVVAGSGSGNLVYVVAVRNNGPSNATGVVITEAPTAPPIGVDLDSITPSAGTTLNDLAWIVGDLAPGASATLTLVLTVDSSAAMATDAISNTATVTALDQTDTNAANDSATDATSISNEVEIAIAVDDSIDPVRAGSGSGNLVYTISATNAGPSDARDLEIVEALTFPAGVTIDAITPGTGSYLPVNDPDGTWRLDIPAGTTATLTATLTVAEDAPNGGTISSASNLVAVDGTDTNDDNNSATEETGILAGVDLVVTKTESADPIVAGSGTGNLEYVVTVTNNGPLDATGLTLSELLNLAEHVVVDSVTPSAGTFDDTTWAVGALAEGASETLTVVLTVGPRAAAGLDVISNTASVSAVDQPQNAPGDESASEATSVVREVDLVVTVLESRDPVLAGFGLPGNLTHTVMVANNGPSDASNITLDLNQVLPAGVSRDTVNPYSQSGFVDPAWTIVSLASGDLSRITFDLNVPATVPGASNTIATTATLTGANETILNPADDSAMEATSVVSPLSMNIGASDIELDLATALFKQTLTITNNNPVAVPAFRVLVNGLPADVAVNNAQGDSGGSSFLLYNQALAPGASIALVVEYRQVGLAGGFEPTFELQLLDSVENQVAAEGAELDRILALPNGDILIEFSSTVGGVYTVQYSHDGENWFNVVPDIIAGATRRQWIDNGPPKTPGHPSTVKGRLYRVVPVDEK